MLSLYFGHFQCNHKHSHSARLNIPKMKKVQEFDDVIINGVHCKKEIVVES